MPRWIGLLGSWALLILAVGIASIAAAGEWINLQDGARLQRLQTVDELIAERNAASLTALRQSQSTGASSLSTLQSQVSNVSKQIDELQDPAQVVIVSTAENRVYLRRGNQVVFQAIASTGKGTTLIDKGRTMVFNTPVGKFKVRSKEENPLWVPPDWHFVEEAGKKGMRVVRLDYGSQIDANTGTVTASRDRGVWSWIDGGDRRVLKVKNKTVVLEENGVERELPAGELITVGGAVVIPPIGVPQRQYDKVLGTHRLNLGDGYALHGTQQVSQLGQSVSHGCVRLANEDIATLYGMVNVGDEVIIY